ncbi:MAG: hypothetical protein AAGD28_18705, partial [Bacteroidota bacterium]
MGWDVQGYYKNSGEEAPSWHVECSGDSVDEVEAFGGKNPLDTEHADAVKIYYGNRGLELFRGFSTLTNQDELKKQLAKFEGYPVYAKKWNPLKKAFQYKMIEYLAAGSLLIFHEKIEGDSDLLKRGLTDILDRLTFRGESDQF